MPTACHYSANGASDVHMIEDGTRTLELSFRIDWGDDDLRASASKPLAFCSFGHLAAWATEKAAQHDGKSLFEGAA